MAVLLFKSTNVDITETESNNARYRSSLVTFYNKKMGFVYTVRQSLINSLCREVILAVGMRFSGRCRYGEVAILERFK